MAELMFPLQFLRQYEGPLDVTAVFETLADLNAHLTDPTRYAGQIVTCEESEGTVYILNNTRDAWLTVSGGAGGSTSADIVSLVDVGAIEAGDTVTGGSTLDDVLQQLLIQTFYPTLVAPSATLSTSLAAQVEAGTTSDLVLTTAFDRGQILGDMAGSVWDAAAVQDFRAGAATSITIEGVVAPGTRTLTGHQITDGTNTFSASIDHDIGPQPLDSTGANYDAPLPAGSVAATATIEGYRNRFHGTPATAPATSADVRALSDSALHPTAGSNFTINIPIGAANVVFAYPETLGEITSVKYVEGLNAEVKGIFTESVISVEGANGYVGVNYRVYTYTPAGPFSATATYNVTI